MKKLLTIVPFLFIFLLAGCNSELKITVLPENNAQVEFRTDYSKTFKDTFSALTGKNDSTVFSDQNLLNLLRQLGTKSPHASQTGNSMQLKCICSTTDSRFTGLDILTVKDKTAVLTIGPEQIKNLYSQSDEETKSYLDLLMIPCLEDEIMTVPEYEELLASLYGKTFAKDLVSGRLKVELAFSGKKETCRAEITIGELFTLTQAKTWQLSSN